MVKKELSLCFALCESPSVRSVRVCVCPSAVSVSDDRPAPHYHVSRWINLLFRHLVIYWLTWIWSCVFFGGFFFAKSPKSEHVPHEDLRKINKYLPGFAVYRGAESDATVRWMKAGFCLTELFQKWPTAWRTAGLTARRACFWYLRSGS